MPSSACKKIDVDQPLSASYITQFLNKRIRVPGGTKHLKPDMELVFASPLTIPHFGAVRVINDMLALIDLIFAEQDFVFSIPLQRLHQQLETFSGQRLPQILKTLCRLPLTVILGVNAELISVRLPTEGFSISGAIADH